MPPLRLIPQLSLDGHTLYSRPGLAERLPPLWGHWADQYVAEAHSAVAECGCSGCLARVRSMPVAYSLAYMLAGLHPDGKGMTTFEALAVEGMAQLHDRMITKEKTHEPD